MTATLALQELQASGPAPKRASESSAPRRPVLERIFARPVVFFSLIFSFTLAEMFWFSRAVTFEPGSVLPFLLSFTFGALSLNVSILATQAL